MFVLYFGPSFPTKKYKAAYVLSTGITFSLALDQGVSIGTRGQDCCLVNSNEFVKVYYVA
jgi:hypothetical protein